MTDSELVSIVMPSFNQAAFIERSIDSVFRQRDRNIELIIADGGSTDGTQNVLQGKAQQYSSLRWNSAPDSGPADALNKALGQVKGEIVGWLNSDDLYTEGAVDRVVAAFRSHRDWIMCYGQGQHIDADGQVLGPYPTHPPSAGIEAFAHGCFICQPTMFFKTSLLALLGPLDETLKTSFDYDYWLRAFQAVPDRIGFIDAVQAQSRLHDECITVNMRRTVAVEGVQLGRKYLDRGIPHWLTTYLEGVRAEMQESGTEAAFSNHALALLDEVSNCFEPQELARLRDAIVQNG